MASMNVDDNNWMDANLDMEQIDASTDQVELYNICRIYSSAHGRINVGNLFEFVPSPSIHKVGLFIIEYVFMLVRNAENKRTFCNPPTCLDYRNI
jgi:hypothetical protein